MPPLDKNGSYVIEGPWKDAPELTVKDGVPKGTVTMFELKSEESKFYKEGRGGAPFVRQCWVYVPAGYVPGTELPLMVDHDGRNRGDSVEPDCHHGQSDRGETHTDDGRGVHRGGAAAERGV